MNRPLMAAISLAVSILSVLSCSLRPLQELSLEIFVSDEWQEAPDPLNLPAGSSWQIAGSVPVTIAERGSSGCISLSGNEDGYIVRALQAGSAVICLIVRDEVIRSYSVNVYSDGDDGWVSIGGNDIELGSILNH